MDKDLEAILAESYLDGLSERPLDAIRTARADCRALETQLSYLRRMIQGRHDVLAAELDRRAHGGAPDDVASLIERLPDILADRGRASGPGHQPEDPRPDQLSGALADRFEEISEVVSLAELSAVSDERLRAAMDDLTALELEVSGHRRALFERIDCIEAELLARYRDGGADADELLAGAASGNGGGGSPDQPSRASR